MMKQLTYEVCDSPVGNVQAVLDQDVLVLIDFSENSERIRRLLERRFGNYALTASSNGLVRQRLERYFEGDWTAFEGLVWETGGTSFQCSVWRALSNIPRGETLSYHELAERVGNPRAIRAAASANANNPIAIVIPCHRVIGKDGALRGYAGGVNRKEWLLKHEGAY